MPASTSCWVRRPRRGSLIAALCILAAATPSGAQDLSVSARITGPPAIDVINKQAVPVAILVANDGMDSRQLVIEAVLPKGWKTIGDGSAFSLASGSRDLRLMAVIVPGSAPAGAYRLEFLVREGSGGAVLEYTQLAVTILRAPRIELHVAEHPSFVVAGASYEAAFLLVNTGNTDVDPELVWEENLGFAIGSVGSPGTLGALAPGDQRTVTLSVKSDPSIRATVTHHVTLKVRDKSGGGALAEGTQPFLAWTSLETEVVPIGTAGEVRMHTLNLDSETLATLAYSETLSATVKESLSLTGTLDEKGMNSIQAMAVKALPTGSTSPFGPQDRVSLAWWNRMASVMAGTGTFSLLPLLASDVNGLGAQVYLRPQGLRVAAMYVTDPWSDVIPDWLGAAVGASFPLRATAAEAVYGFDVGFRQSLPGGATFGLLQRLRPLAGLELMLETALRTGLSIGEAPAVLAGLTIKAGAVDGAIQAMKAWPGYSDQTREAESLRANLGLSLFGNNLRIVVSASWSASSLLLDTVQPADHPILSATLSADGSIPDWGSRPSFGLQLVRQRSSPPLSGSDWLDVLLRASWMQVAGDFGLKALSTLGSRYGLPGKAPEVKLVEEVSLDWQKTGMPGLSASLRYEGGQKDGGLDASTFNASVGTRLGSGAASFEADLQSTLSFLGPDYTGILLGLSGSVAYLFPWNASLHAKLEAGLAGKDLDWKPSLSLSISYGTTPDIAIYRNGDSAEIRGKVFDQLSGLPLSGVLLRAGTLADITDAKGEYRFNMPQSGMYYLQVDRRTLGPNQIPSRPVPIPAQVLPGSTLVVDIGIVAHASLAGSVNLWGYPDNGLYDPTPGKAEVTRTAAGGIGNLILELRDGSLIQRRITDREGRFEFEELRPGHYSLEVIGGTIPEYSHFEVPHFEIDLAPGEAGSVELRVLAERRQIRIQQSGLPDLIGPSVDAGISDSLPATTGMPVPLSPRP